MVLEEKTISDKTIFSGRIIKVHTQEIAFPDGKRAQREIVEHPGGVGIVAVTDDNKIVMVKQYRKAVEKAIYEIPAGKLEGGEEPIKCGIRELTEETGYTAENFEYLGYIYPSPGFTDEVTHVFLATGLKLGNACPDEDEYVDVEYFTFDEILEKIMNNEINDAKTVMGFFKAAEKLKGR